MTTRIATAHSDRVDGPFLRAIGSLVLEAHELHGLRAEADPAAADQNLRGWCDFADHLLATVEAVVHGASTASGAGNTIPVRRDGVVVPVGLDYLTKLATRVQRHVRIAPALGIGETDGMLVAV